MTRPRRHLARARIFTGALALGVVAACSGAGDASPDRAPTHLGATPGDEWHATAPDAPSSAPTPPAPAAEPPAAPRCAAPPPAAPGADVAIEVHAARGPHGRPAPVAVDRRFYGMNIADWEPHDYAPTPRPAFLELLRALRPGVLRWPAGHRSQEYVWERGGDGQHGDWTLTAAHVDAFVALARAVGAEPLVAINAKRGTPAAAASLLRYLNVEKGYGVRWLQIGNEPDLTDGVTDGPAAYAEQVVRFADALHAVDEGVRLVGPELLTGAHVGGIHGTVDWMTPILAAVGGRIDGISWHYYPLDSAQAHPHSSARMSVEHLFQESAHDWRPASLAYADEIMPALAELRDRHAPGAEIWITELAEDPGPDAGAGLSDTLAGALWAADVLGRYGAYGPGAVLRWLFKGSAMHKYALVGHDDAPRPAFAAYWLYARHFGERFVDTTTSNLPAVAAHAALREDGALTLVLVNKTTATKRAAIALDGFAACSADALVLSGDGYGATTVRLDGLPFDAAAATAAHAPLPLPADRLFEVALPPTSIALVQYLP